jgi:hypothetical protein
MQIHGLRYQTQASVQVNNSAWAPINSSSVTLQGNALAYGGIGGGFSTLKMTMNLPAGAITIGTNTIAFRFNQTDGRVSGFRVLAFNILDPNGNSLISASTFVNDDPSTWQPPSSAASDISAGQSLFQTAQLTIPTSGGTQTIQAHCSDCHAQDGRDLKYFNYSNNSIQGRALFHGLTAQQGNQIASYIRTLNVANPGRPWNPPYQPGPGLDSQPVINWAAGAGLDAVLDNDQEVMSGMFPSGVQSSVFAPTGNLDIRETAVAFQFPDWNQWLPGTHPMDGFGAAFVTSPYNTLYSTIRANLQVLDSTAYVSQKNNLDQWDDGYYTLDQTVVAPLVKNTALWTPSMVDSVYSLAQWGMVKHWELMNQFQLEGFGQDIFASTAADQRAWYSELPFLTSPHELQMPSTGVAGLRNGTKPTYTYLSYIWYHLQLILDNSNKQQHDHQPIDWGYAAGFVMNMGTLVSPQGAIQTMWTIKGLQVEDNGSTPALGQEGWQPTVSNVGLLVAPEYNVYVWTGVDPTTRVALATGMVSAWLGQASQFTPQQYYTGGWASPTVNPVPGGNAYGQFADWIWYLIPRLNFIGVEPSLSAQLATWAKTIWPNANWTADLNATCTEPTPLYGGVIECSQ